MEDNRNQTTFIGFHLSTNDEMLSLGTSFEPHQRPGYPVPPMEYENMLGFYAYHCAVCPAVRCGIFEPSQRLIPPDSSSESANMSDVSEPCSDNVESATVEVTTTIRIAEVKFETLDDGEKFLLEDTIRTQAAWSLDVLRDNVRVGLSSGSLLAMITYFPIFALPPPESLQPLILRDIAVLQDIVLLSTVEVVSAEKLPAIISVATRDISYTESETAAPIGLSTQDLPEPIIVAAPAPDYEIATMEYAIGVAPYVREGDIYPQNELSFQHPGTNFNLNYRRLHSQKEPEIPKIDCDYGGYGYVYYLGDDESTWNSANPYPGTVASGDSLVNVKTIKINRFTAHKIEYKTEDGIVYAVLPGGIDYLLQIIKLQFTTGCDANYLDILLGAYAQKCSSAFLTQVEVSGYLESWDASSDGSNFDVVYNILAENWKQSETTDPLKVPTDSFSSVILMTEGGKFTFWLKVEFPKPLIMESTT